jgi:hypothetical protein
MKTAEKSWSARQVHEELAMFAWERLRQTGPILCSPLDPRDLLKAHLRMMQEILTDTERYTELWRRIRAKESA